MEKVQTINRWDLNSNGSLNLVFANSHPHAEKLDAVGTGTFYQRSGEMANSSAGAWFQYRVLFILPDGVNYPTLDEVAIHFANVPPEAAAHLPDGE